MESRIDTTVSSTEGAEECGEPRMGGTIFFSGYCASESSLAADAFIKLGLLALFSPSLEAILSHRQRLLFGTRRAHDGGGELAFGFSWHEWRYKPNVWNPSTLFLRP